MKFLKKVIEKIMADIKSIRNGSKSKQSEELTPKEIVFLLQTIPKSTFFGQDVQIFYETSVKLPTLINDKS